MEFGITDREMRILLKSQKGELEGVMMYKALADVVDDPTLKAAPFVQINTKNDRMRKNAVREKNPHV